MAQKEREFAALTRTHSSGDITEPWVRLQKKAFTAWCNEHLRKREVYIADLGTELCDGVKLLHLLEVLSKHLVENGKWVKAPKTRFEKLQNVSWGLKFMTSQGIKIIAIGPEDLVDPKLKLILGLIWLLILKYLVSKGSSGGSAKADTMAWVRKRTGNDAIKDFNPQTWADGRLYCGIIHSIKPDERINPATIDPANGLKNVQTAMEIAEKDLGVPHILDPEDILAPEELSFITYLSILRDKAADLESGKVVTPRAAPAPAPVKDFTSAISIEPTALTVGDSANFKVQLKERSTGVDVPKGGQNFKAKLTDSTNTEVKTEPKDNGDGSYTIPFKPAKAGEHRLAVLVDDKPAGSAFSVVVQPPAADPSKSTLSFAPASPVPVGTKVIATLQLTDRTGANLAGVGTTPVRAVLATPDGDNALEGKDNGNGSLSYPFTTKKAGDHNVRTFVANQPSVSGTVTAVDGADTANSIVELTPASKVKVGDKVAAKVSIKDSNGKLAAPSTSGAVRAVVAAPGGESSLTLTDNKDGTFTGDFTPAKAGEHSVRAFLNDKPIKPASVNVAAGVSAEKSDVTLDPKEPIAGEQVTATVQLRDDSDKEADSTDAKVEGSLKSFSPQGNAPLNFAATKPASAGKFVATFTPTKAGEYAVVPKVNGDAIKPANFTVKAAVDAGSSKIDVSPASPVEGDEVTGHLTLHGKDGSAIAPAGNNADAKVSGPDGKTVPSTTIADENGFNIKFPAKAAGAYKIAPTVNGKSAPEKSVQVDADVDPKGTKVEVDPKAPVVNDKVSATVTLMDRKGKPRTTGGPKVTTKVTDPKGKSESPAVKDNNDGTYGLTFPAKEVGTYALTPSVNGEPVAATDVPVASNVDTDKATVTVDPAAPAAGDKTKGTVKVVDANGKPLSGVPVEASLVGPDGKEIPVKVKDNGDGTYSFDLPTDKPGEYTVNAKVGGKPLAPVKVHVKPNVDAKKSTVTVDPASPVAGDTPKATVKLVDANGKPVSGVPVEAIFTGPDGKEIPVKVVDNGDGTYIIDLPTDKPGDYTLNVKADGKPLAPAKVLVKPNIDAGKSSVAVDPTAPVAGDKTKATVKVADADGKLLSGVPVEASLVGPDGKEIPVKVKDNGDGTYTIDLPTDKPGDYTLNVKAGGKPLEPTKVHVKPNVDAKKSTVTVDPAAPKAGDKTKATVKLVDANGKPVSGVPVDATLTGPDGKEIPVKVVDNGDGTYTIDLPTDKPGDYTLAVKADGKPLAPVKVSVKPSVDASKSSVAVDPATPKAGDKTNATVKVADADGKPVSGVPVEATFVSPDGKESPVKLKDNGDGTYTGSLPINKPGDYTLAAKADGKPLEPVKVTVKPNVDAKKSTVTVDPAAPKAGDKVKATVKLVDADGKPVSGVPVDATLIGPDGKEIPVTVVDNGDGTYSIELPADKPGDYTLKVNADGKPLAPVKVSVKPNVDASKSTVSVVPATPKAGDKTKATVKLVDADGKPVSGVPVDATLIGPDGKEIPVKAKDNGDGTYTIDLPTDKPGDYALKVNADGKPLEPVKVTVKPNVDAKKSTVTVDPATPVAGDTPKATVKLVDANGKPIPGGVPVEATLIGPDGKEIPVKVVDNGDGTYTIDLPTDKPGDYTLNVKADGKPLAPVKVSVKAKVDPSKSSATGEGLKTAVVGRPAPIATEAKDTTGKVVPDAQFEVTVDQANGKPVKAEEKPKNKWAYVATEPGKATVTVKVAGENVPGSPFAVDVQPAADPSKTETTFVPAKPHQGDKVTATIQLKDAEGKNIPYGGDAVAAGVLMPNAKKPETLKVTDNNNGTYTAQFPADHVGPHVVEPTVNAKSAPAAQVDVKPAVDPAQSKAHGPGLRHAVVGRPAEFFVEALNANGKRVDGVQSNVAIKSEAGPLDVKQPGLTGKVPNQGHGHAVVNYTPTQKGLHQVEVTIEDKPVNGSPFRVPVELAPDAKSTDLAVSPTKPATGDKLTGKATLKDADGKPITYGGEKFEADLAGPNGEKIPVEVKDNNDGTFALASSPLTKPGEHVLNTKVNGAPGPSKNFKVQPPVDLTKCNAKGDGLKKAIVGKKSEFVLQARDKDDKPLAGVPFTVSITGPKGEVIPVTAAPESSADGEIHVSYVAPVAGPLTIRAKHDGGDIKGSPFTVTAKKPPAAKQSRSKWTFEVELVDEDGCDMTEGGDDVQVKMFDIKTPETPLPLKFKDAGSGKYLLEFTLPHAGEFEINVTVGGEHIAGSPFRQVAHT